MGMFDSFYIENNREIQTKKLNQNLENFSLGDTIPNYEGNYDGPTGNFYIIEDEKDDFVSLIIINNIFIDYLIDSDSENLSLKTKDLFKTYLSHPTLLSLRLSEIIKNRLNPMLTTLSKKLTTVDRILHEYKIYMTDPNYEEKKFSSLLYRYMDRFKNGETVDTLILEAMNTEHEEELLEN
jgi:hypothetical protein